MLMPWQQQERAAQRVNSVLIRAFRWGLHLVSVIVVGCDLDMRWVLGGPSQLFFSGSATQACRVAFTSG